MYCICFFNVTGTTVIYTVCNTLSLHDALPISAARPHQWARGGRGAKNGAKFTSQLTSAPTPTSVPYTAPMHHRSPLQSLQHEFPSGASDAGVYQLSDRKSTRLNSSH